MSTRWEMASDPPAPSSACAERLAAVQRAARWCSAIRVDQLMDDEIVNADKLS